MKRKCKKMTWGRSPTTGRKDCRLSSGEPHVITMLSIQVKEKVFDYAPVHELNEITELLTKKGLASFTALRDVPSVNDIKTTLLEVTNVARRRIGPLHFGDGRDLHIRVADRSADRAPVSGNPGKKLAPHRSRTRRRALPGPRQTWLPPLPTAARDVCSW